MDISWAIRCGPTALEGLPERLLDTLNFQDPSYFLAGFSSHALEPKWTTQIFTFFEPIALELAVWWTDYQYDVALCAFGRILPVFHRLTSVAESLFDSPKRDQGLLHSLFDPDSKMYAFRQDSDVIGARELLLGVYRLLRTNNSVFAKYIRPAKLQLLLQHEDQVVRLLAIRILCLYLHASDAVFEDMKRKHLKEGAIEGNWEDRTIDYTFLILWEDKRIKDMQNQLSEFREKREKDSDENEDIENIIDDHQFAPNVISAYDVLLLRPRNASSTAKAVSDLVETHETMVSYARFSEALLQEKPILVTGPMGCGKTAVIRDMAERLGTCSSMITLHLNEQSDAKLLIGLYTTGSEPGTFQWQPGVLTTAVKEGRWVLIEDLDRASKEVMGVLLPLIERRELLIPSRGEKLTAHTDFRIIATLRSYVDGQTQEKSSPSLKILGSRLWHKIWFNGLSRKAQNDIVNSQFRLLELHTKPIIAAYERVRSEFARLPASKSSLPRTRQLSLRELLKCCTRVKNTVPQQEQDNLSTEPISENSLNCMFLDAADLFVGNLEDTKTREYLISCVAEEMHIDSNRMKYILRQRPIQIKSISKPHEESSEIGRATLIHSMSQNSPPALLSPKNKLFALNPHSLKLLEQAARAVQYREPLLLVGETGIGKTAAIQHLAQILGKKFLAINLSQQSESSDLLGGLKPLNLRSLVISLKEEFDELFDTTFSHKKNQHFMEMLAKCVQNGQFKRALTLWKEAIKMARKTSQSSKEVGNGGNTHGEQRSKRRKLGALRTSYESKWEAFATKVDSLEQQLSRPSGAHTFVFSEGKLVKAVRDGDWVLLDEINLTTPDTLEAIADLLEAGPNSTSSILLTEAANVERVEAHPDFRLFAAMNPATDIGKKDLPIGIRSRFTEIYVNPPDNDVQSLQNIVETYLGLMSQSSAVKKIAASITDLYLEMQRLVKEAGLVDGSGDRPHYSLRTLTRALSHANIVSSQCSFRRALYEGFCMCFLTCLGTESEANLQQNLQNKIFGSVTQANAELKNPLKEPKDKLHINVELQIHRTEKSTLQSTEYHWLPQGREAVENPTQYIITPYIYRNLRNLNRAVSGRKYPILIQGPTSAGKTSMIEYLAKRSGNKFVRVNNHEHTDLQEYLGTYVSNSSGKLTFQEGVLVKALREGHWIVLDELNLAPTDVLEALNRLLDDNRELLIPETQETVQPHPDFMLFATQNPVGPYGGRKILSRAFRNRFLELHFDDIPITELNIILSRRSNLPESWCRLIVEVYSRLSALRQEQRIFEHHSFATLRDLFRWALRGGDDVESLAITGYMLLAEKVRKAEERRAIKGIIENVMSGKGVKVRIDEEELYDQCVNIKLKELVETCGDGVVWTKSMKRLFVLVSEAMTNNEPVLLVGETGCGKTTVCQMLARATNKTLHIINAHQNTETGDLIGAQRPIRNRAAIEQDLFHDLQQVFERTRELHETQGNDYNSIEKLLQYYDTVSKEEHFSIPSELVHRISRNRAKQTALFEWCDGSLVQAMRQGDYYLLDEISLAEDSVLERMNSVLDPQRSILLAEKGVEDVVVQASEGFQFLATMNPGGDFGKKELSPALRNRFTEIWVPPLSDETDILQIVQERIRPEAKSWSEVFVKFAKWFIQRYGNMKTETISVRDILTWVQFVNIRESPILSSIVHGANMVYVDSLGANPSAFVAITEEKVNEERKLCLETLSNLLEKDPEDFVDSTPAFSQTDKTLDVGGFSIKTRNTPQADLDFHFNAPTTLSNVMRVLRGLQLSKPILLEGRPGVGKTSIIAALAKAAGVPLTRINLSEQTDVMDLFGSDVPIEHGNAGQFTWRDAPFLSAMKRGEWVLLDEMNLASQSVLEGLNACLDHRGQVYISELDHTFERHPDFRLFATQNPHHQGGGRKGLPASFVNRFTVVFADVLSLEDLAIICTQLYPSVDDEDLAKIVTFVTQMDVQVGQLHKFGAQGSPWEFNLRDTLRWLQLLTSTKGLLPGGQLEDYVSTLFLQRFRTSDDVQRVGEIFDSVFAKSPEEQDLFTNLSPKTFQLGVALLSRSKLIQKGPSIDRIKLAGRLHLFQPLMHCVQQNWPVLLVGPSGAGKSYLIQALAACVGAKLETFAMNADIDATDLVGGFEQVDPARQVQSFLQNVETFALNTLAFESSNTDLLDDNIVSSRLCDILDHLKSSPPDQISLKKISRALSDIRELKYTDVVEILLDQCEELSNAPKIAHAARFEWLDGMLIQALEKGSWLVLDNANLCSSSVLDRLNSLLEPNGYLIVNEHCSEDGVARVVKPHPDFRIFLTMDPQHGEVSRAMRNRSVELFVTPWEASAVAENSEFDRDLLLESSMSRFVQISVSVPWQDESFNDTFVYPAIGEAFYMLSSGDIAKLSRFCTELINMFGGEGFREGRAHILKERTTDLELLLERWSSTMACGPQRFYESINVPDLERVDFIQAQPINSLWNQPLLSFAKRFSPTFDAFAYGAVCDLTLFWETFMRVLSSLRGLIYDTNEASRMERSLNRDIIPNAEQDSTAFLSEFFTEMGDLIMIWAADYMKTNGSRKTMLIIGQHLTSFCGKLFTMALHPFFDEAEFQAYLTCGLQIVNSIPDDNDSSRMPLKTHFEKPFRNLHRSRKLSTGLSMERIWKSFGPIRAPTSGEVVLFEKAALDFDQLVWKLSIPLKEKAALHQSIAKAIYVASHESEQEIDPLTNDFVKQLESHRKFEDTKNPSQPILWKTFEGICQRDDLEFSSPERISPQSQNLELDSTLSLLAMRTTASLFSAGVRTPSAKMLGALSAYSGGSHVEFVPKKNLSCLVVNELVTTEQISLAMMGQLGNELQVLGKALALKTAQLGGNQAQSLHQCLRALLTTVLISHSDMISPSVHQYVTRVLAGDNPLIEDCNLSEGLHEDSHLYPVAKEFLQPCLDVLLSIDYSKDGAFAALGFAYIKFALGCLFLYVPDFSFDPAMRAIVEKRLHERLLFELQRRLNVVKLLEETLTGQNYNFLCKFLERDMLDVGPAPQTDLTIRKNPKQLEELQTENLVTLSLIKRLSRLKNWSQMPITEIKSYSSTALQLIHRLSLKYWGYRDITKPLVGFLNCLRMGMTLIVSHSMEGELREWRNLFRTIPFTGSDPCSTSSVSRNTSTDFIEQELSLLSLKSWIQLPESWDLSAIEDTSSLFDELFRRWKSQLSSDQEQAAIASSLYHYRGSQDDDEAAENEFAALFPIYEHEERKVEHNENQTSRDDVAKRVASLHIEIFKNRGSSSERALNIMNRTLNKISGLDTECLDLDGSDMRNLLPGLLLSVKTQLDHLSGVNESQSNFSIYTDPKPSEAQKFTDLVKRIETRFVSLAEIWPEHATLHTVISTCAEILNVKHSEPLMKILTKAEKLHTHTTEWQTVASSEYSAATLYDALTDLLISWRQLELSTWARLLHDESETCIDEAKNWWFILYENVIANLTSNELGEYLPKHILELLQTLESFILNASAGHYGARLEMISSLCEHVRILTTANSQLESLHSALHHFVRHFERFTTRVAQIISEGRESLEKDLKNVIQLATWKDRNISALQQSARTSHRKLFRIIRKYREILRQPVKSALAEDIQFISKTEAANHSIEHRQRPMSNSAVAFEILQDDSSSWEYRPARYKNIDATGNAMKAKMGSISSHFDSVSVLEDFLTDLDISIIQLQKATPPTLTEENSVMVKHLTVRKRRVLADTLKEISRMGIKRNIAGDILSAQDSLPKVLTTLALTKTPELDNSAAQQYLHGLLDLIPQVRAALNNHSTDLNQEEISRCVGYFEGLLLINIRQQRSLMSVKNSLTKFDLVLEKMINLSPDQDISIKHHDVHRLTENYIHLAQWLPTIIRVGLKVLEVQSQLGQLDFSSIIATLQDRAEYFERCLRRLAASPKVPMNLNSRAEREVENEIKSNIFNFNVQLDTWSFEVPHAKVALDHIKRWTVPNVDMTVSQVNGQSSQSFHDFNVKLFKCLDEILGSVQDIEVVRDAYPESKDVANWFIQEDDAQRKTLSAFHHGNIVKNLNNLLDGLHLVDGDSPDSLGLAYASVTVAVPIVQQYYDSLFEAMRRYDALHHSTCKLSYRLARSFRELSSKGFCKPLENSEEKGGKSEKLESGTGLGEGDGEEDISKDIGDDEDLSELAQDAQNKRREEGIDNEDDAVGIDDEMEGVGGDDDPGKDEEREVGSEKGEQEERDDLGENAANGGQEREDAEGGEEMDEGVGEVDDLGPSAVDEKLWDQAGEESKELDSKQQTGDVDNNENAATEDKDKREGKQNKEDDESMAEKGGEAENDSDEDDDGSTTSQDAAAEGQDNQLDPHLKETEGLELPEDLQLDGDKTAEADDIDQYSDADMDNALDNDPDEGGDEGSGKDMDAMSMDADEQDDESTRPDEREVEKPDAQDEHDISEHPDDQVEDSTVNNTGVTREDDEGQSGLDRSNAITLDSDTELDPDQNENDDATEKSTSAANAQSKSGEESQRLAGEKSISAEGRESGNQEQQEEYKKLGDILEKWHRQHRPINETSSRQDKGQADQEDVEMASADFEHLPDEDATADTQALGAASQDEARALDERMAMPPGDVVDDHDREDFLPDAADESSSDEDKDVEMADDAPHQGDEQAARDQTQQGATIGRPRDPDVVDKPSQHEQDQEMDEASDLEESLETMQLKTSPSPATASVDMKEASAMWQSYEARTHSLSLVLTEQLRLILAPTLATKLRGDYRTGKRLNIKRIIPYIASQFKRDKIWMRRSIPSKRAYQVLLAIDDSSSMADDLQPTSSNDSGVMPSSSKSLAFETLALVARSLSALEVGEVGVLGFGERVHVAHPLGTPFTTDAGAAVLSQFSFAQRRTDVKLLVQESMELLRAARARQQTQGSGDLWQLELIISDGVCEDHEGIRRLMVQAREERIMVVFVIVDAGAASGQGGGQSIVDLERVEFVQPAEGGEMKMERRKYLDTFPFGYYILVKDVRELPGVLAAALRQWFAEVSEL